MKIKAALVAMIAAVCIMAGTAFGATNVQSAGSVSSDQDVVVMEFKYTEIRHLPPVYWAPYYWAPAPQWRGYSPYWWYPYGW